MSVCLSVEIVLSANAHSFFFVVTDYGAQVIVGGGSFNFHLLIQQQAFLIFITYFVLILMYVRTRIPCL